MIGMAATFNNFPLTNTIMNSDDLLKAFILAGLDTPEKVQAILTDLAAQLEIKRIDIQLNELNAKRAEVLKPLDDVRIELTNQQAALSLKLSAGK